MSIINKLPIDVNKEIVKFIGQKKIIPLTISFSDSDSIYNIYKYNREYTIRNEGNKIILVTTSKKKLLSLLYMTLKNDVEMEYLDSDQNDDEFYRYITLGYGELEIVTKFYTSNIIPDILFRSKLNNDMYRFNDTLERMFNFCGDFFTRD